MEGEFSGEETRDIDSLDRLLTDAKSVRITPRGCLVYAVDPSADVLDPAVPKRFQLMSDEVLAHVDDPVAMSQLRAALAVERIGDGVCMCPGNLALDFLDAEGKRITVVRIDSPGTVDWPLWTGKADVVDLDALRGWLREHGADGPLLDREAYQANWAATATPYASDPALAQDDHPG
jgi:hypothetical protein